MINKIFQSNSPTPFTENPQPTYSLISSSGEINKKYTNKTKANMAAHWDKIKNTGAAIGYGISGVTTGLAGIAFAAVTFPLGLLFGSIGGAAVGAIKNLDLNTRAETVKENAITGVKYGALGFFILAKMAFEEAHKLANIETQIKKEPKIPQHPDGPVYGGL